jgi:hypothetical protein
LLGAGRSCGLGDGVFSTELHIKGNILEFLLMGESARTSPTRQKFKLKLNLELFWDRLNKNNRNL